MTFNLRPAMVMFHMHAENQRESSVGSKDSVKTNGPTDATDRTTFPADAVGKEEFCIYKASMHQPFLTTTECYNGLTVFTYSVGQKNRATDP